MILRAMINDRVIDEIKADLCGKNWCSIVECWQKSTGDHLHEIIFNYKFILICFTGCFLVHALKGKKQEILILSPYILDCNDNYAYMTRYAYYALDSLVLYFLKFNCD